MTTATQLPSPQQTRRACAVVDCYTAGINDVTPSAATGTVFDSRSGSPTIIKDSSGYQGVDASHNLRLRFEIPQNVQMIQRVLLAFSLQAWRASQQSTSAGGSAHSHSIPSESVNGATSTSIGTSFSLLNETINNPVQWDGIANSLAVTGGGSQFLPAHSHSVSGQSTSGTTSSSDSTHTHNLNAPTGLIDQAMAQGVHVLIAAAGAGFTDITAALGGPWGVGSALDVSDLDISSYVTSGGWWEVQLSSATLGGIMATVAVLGIVGAL
ncbi:MAG: hypothetical protein ACYDAL_02025 [Candidatus Dormibacteraceae bacterium]